MSSTDAPFTNPPDAQLLYQILAQSLASFDVIANLRVIAHEKVIIAKVSV